ncbi:MAG: sugar ABC transporter permease [Chloroflexota bacterium]
MTGRSAALSRPIARRRGGAPRATGPLRGAERRAGILFSLPVIVLTGALLFLPIIQTFYYSLTSWNGITSKWVGLDNFRQMVDDPVFWRVLLNNAFLLLSIPFAILIPLMVAFLLHQHVFGWRVFRSLYFLPTAISWVVIGMVAARVFASRGILNDLLAMVGLRADLLTNEYTAMLAVILTFIWSVFGTNTIIFITGMATLDRDIYEAAKVDGAGGLAIFRFITIPLLMRFIQFTFVLTLITGFTALFSLIFVMTTGGPGYGTTTLEFFVYQKAFAQGVFGYAAAIGVALFAIVFAINLVQQRLLRSRED